jgi:hypothetical protein
MARNRSWAFIVSGFNAGIQKKRNKKIPDFFDNLKSDLLSKYDFYTFVLRIFSDKIP